MLKSTLPNGELRKVILGVPEKLRCAQIPPFTKPEHAGEAPPIALALPRSPRSLIEGSAERKRVWPPDSAGKEVRGSQPQAGMQTRCPDPSCSYVLTHTHTCVCGAEHRAVWMWLTAALHPNSITPRRPDPNVQSVRRKGPAVFHF